MSFRDPEHGHRGAELSCPICNLRKEKRFCPAVHDRICAQCCGEQREVTLQCPSECPYLQQARQHERPRELPQAAEELFPAVHLRPDFMQQHEPLVLGLLQILSKISTDDRQLSDRELIGALANMARSQQTLITSGLVFEEVMPNPVQQAVMATLRRCFEEYREVETMHLGYARLKDTDVLHVLVFTLRLAHMHTSGRPLSRRFLDFLQQKFPQSALPPESATDPGSRIIIP